MSDPRPIGVFDSGIGGLTVVKALRELLPNEDIFYLGDTARVPYGGKSATTVERYSLEMADMLLEENVKLVVIACNSASAVALGRLEQTLSVPVIGVIKPGAQAALAATRNRHVAVIGTRATIKSGAYERELRALNPDGRISVRACPLLVPLIEEGWLDDELTNSVIARYLEPLTHDGIDTLVLACTSCPLLAAATAASTTICASLPVNASPPTHRSDRSSYAVPRLEFRCQSPRCSSVSCSYDSRVELAHIGREGREPARDRILDLLSLEPHLAEQARTSCHLL